MEEAKKLYGDKDDIQLKEALAEGFREYVMTRQNRGLGKKIIDFFKELFTKVTNWNNIRPSLIDYYRRINEGKYAGYGQDKEGLDFAYYSNPELATIGSKEQYSEYLKTIFPNSKTPNIYYHGGKRGIETFKAPNDYDFQKNKGVNSGTKDYGIYFTGDKSIAKYYSKGYSKSNRQIYPVLLNTQESYKTNKFLALNLRRLLGSTVLNPQSITEKDFNTTLKGKDSVIWHGEKGEIIVFNPSQIHILGSKSDVEGFRNYVKNQGKVTTISKLRVINNYTEEERNILSKAKRDSEGNLLAPNGKKSNLTERQYAQVRTKAFKNWFGDWENNPENASKVVDENGEPLVVYHGTTTPNITTFDLAKTRSGGAFWFANMEAQKGVFYSDQNDENLIMMPLFVNMRTPLLNDANSMESYATDETHDGGLILGKLGDFKDDFADDEYQELLDKGLNDSSYLAAGNVANPNQLKSAASNIGTFSTTNDDIRYRKVPNSSFESLDTEMKENLLKKGWTVEKFNSISQEERDQAVKCIAF